MKRQKKHTHDVIKPVPRAQVVEGLEEPQKPLCWETFFQCQRSPVLRSQLLAALLNGTRLVVERLPQSALLDAVLLGFAARVYCEAEIVDNWAELLRRTEEEWERPDWTCRIFDSIHTSAANNIVKGQVSNFTCVEEQYIPDMVQWYLEHDLPEYFSQEIEALPKKDAVKLPTKLVGRSLKLSAKRTSKNLNGAKKK